jgi:hypothetical protein
VLLSCCLFEIFFQGIKLRFPEGLVLRDPGGRVFHRFGGQPAAVHAAVDFALQQPGGFQHAEVLGNGRQRHLERLCQFSDHRCAARQPRQQGPAGGIGERAKSGIQGRGGIVNHMV